MSSQADVKRCLKYINVYIEQDDPSLSRVRGFLDEWYGYTVGGAHLTRGGRVRWLNNPDYTNPIIRDCLEGMDFVSAEARKVLNGEIEGRLIKEHAVPIKVIRKKLLEIDNDPSNSIERCLGKYYKLGVLTKLEDHKLNEMGLQSSMPLYWNDSEPFARYEEAGILRG